MKTPEKETRNARRIKEKANVLQAMFYFVITGAIVVAFGQANYAVFSATIYFEGAAVYTFCTGICLFVIGRNCLLVCLLDYRKILK